MGWEWLASQALPGDVPDFCSGSSMLCRHDLPKTQLVAMVELLSLMQGMASELQEAEKWMPPLLQQAMHEQTKSFVTDTLPSLTRGSKVRPRHSSGSELAQTFPQAAASKQKRNSTMDNSQSLAAPLVVGLGPHKEWPTKG